MQTYIKSADLSPFVKNKLLFIEILSIFALHLDGRGAL